jgi:hypothetical protein
MANLHLLGQPDTFLAGEEHAAAGARRALRFSGGPAGDVQDPDAGRRDHAYSSMFQMCQV